MDQTWPAGDGHMTQVSSMSQTQDFCWNYEKRKFLFFHSVWDWEGWKWLHWVARASLRAEPRPRRAAPRDRGRSSPVTLFEPRDPDMPEAASHLFFQWGTKNSFSLPKLVRGRISISYNQQSWSSAFLFSQAVRPVLPYLSAFAQAVLSTLMS